MPFLKNGGLFIPRMAASKIDEQPLTHYKLRDSVCLLLQLLDDSQRHFCISNVVWITPTKIHGDRYQGIGLHFERNDSQLRSFIESQLGAYKPQSGQPPTLETLFRSA